MVDRQVRNVDIWPTLFDLLGIEFQGPSDGQSVRPLIEAAAKAEASPVEPSDVALAFLDQNWGQHDPMAAPMVSVQRAGMRLIMKSKPERLELYDHASDPAEQRNVAAERPELVVALRSYADGPLSSGAPPWGQEPPPG